MEKAIGIIREELTEPDLGQFHGTSPNSSLKWGVETWVVAEVSIKNTSSVKIIYISDLQYNLDTRQKVGVFTAICVAVSRGYSMFSWCKALC